MKSWFISIRPVLSLLGLLPLASRADATPGAVYTLTNAVAGNAVRVFSRDAHGELTPGDAFPTGGLGTGAGLGSQSALAFAGERRWLLAVNPGSNTVSVFSVEKDGLTLVDVTPSGGARPISVTAADNLVYVLNAGGAAGAVDNISGFYLTKHGELLPLPGSTRPLSAANVAPAQVGFGPHGDTLVVSEKATSRLVGFAIDDTGRPGTHVITPSSGATPFGFAISRRGDVFVSEAAVSALSSYAIQPDASLETITGSLVNGQAAACWVVLSRDERHAYTANAASNSISSYLVAPDGSLTLLQGHAASANRPIDMAVSVDGRFLYALNAANATVSGYAVSPDGSLTQFASVGGLPASCAGLLAR